ncbi:MAG TPA: RraA family protein, partial [Vicinamibacteria bacterium]
MKDIERLARLDTGAVSDALDRLGSRGAVSGIRPLTG